MSAAGVQVDVVDQLVAGITGGEWVAAGLRSGEAAVVDGGPRPVQRLATAGLGDLVPLVEPMQQAVDRMVVDSSAAMFADAWQRVADAVERAGQQLVRSARSSEADWTGGAAERYRERAVRTAAVLSGAARVFAANSVATRMMGGVVSAAYKQASDLLDRLVDELISYVRAASSVAGGMTAEVLNEAACLVDSYAQPVAGIEEQLRQTARQLASAPGLGPASGILGAVRDALAFDPVPAPAISRLSNMATMGVGDPNLVLASYDGSLSGGGTVAAASFQPAGVDAGGTPAPDGVQSRGLAAESGGGAVNLAQTRQTAGTDAPWKAKARELAEKLGIRDWDPSKGFAHNRETVKKVYEYYAQLWADKPQLQWAGMARLAGGVVYQGFETMQFPHTTEYMRWWEGVTPGQFTAFEAKFLEMHQSVFLDLAYPHEVYRQEGIVGIERLNQNGELPPGTIDSWRKIDSGVPEQVAEGNKELLYREQREVLQPIYDKISRMPNGDVFTEAVSAVTTSPVPDGQAFSDHGGNVANFDDRWDWIEKDMFPKYQKLLTDPLEANRLILERVGQLPSIPQGAP